MELVNAKVGIVSQVDPNGPFVKVWWPGEDEDEAPVKQTSPWLFVQRMGNFYYVPEVNEQVLVMLDQDRNEGVVLGSIIPEGAYSDANVIGFKIATVEIKIEKDSGKTSITLNGDATIKAPNIKLDGDVSITGDLDVTKKIAATGNISTNGKLDAVGIIKSQADVQTLTVKMNTHTHASAAPGSPTTPPIPTP